MKTLLLLALLALAASTAFAQYAQVGGGEAECGTELAPTLNSCKDYTMERCSTMKDFPVSWPWKWWKGGCEHEVRYKCCEQLNQVKPECRCKALWRAVQGELGGFFGLSKWEIGKHMQRAKSIPSKCNMGPECNFPLPAGYYW